MVDGRDERRQPMQLSAEELASQTLKPETLQFAVQSVRVNGYVIFESVLPRDRVQTLHSTFLRVLEGYMARTDSNRGANRYQMHLPFMPPFIDPAVITHP